MSGFSFKISSLCMNTSTPYNRVLKPNSKENKTNCFVIRSCVWKRVESILSVEFFLKKSHFNIGVTSAISQFSEDVSRFIISSITKHRIRRHLNEHRKHILWVCCICHSPSCFHITLQQINLKQLSCWSPIQTMLLFMCYAYVFCYDLTVYVAHDIAHVGFWMRKLQKKLTLLWFFATSIACFTSGGSSMIE